MIALRSKCNQYHQSGLQSWVKWMPIRRPIQESHAFLITYYGRKQNGRDIECRNEDGSEDFFQCISSFVWPISSPDLRQTIHCAHKHTCQSNAQSCMSLSAMTGIERNRSEEASGEAKNSIRHLSPNLLSRVPSGRGQTHRISAQFSQPGGGKFVGSKEYRSRMLKGTPHQSRNMEQLSVCE